jgi:two-component system nitrogen regulation response regulator GlnG
LQKRSLNHVPRYRLRGEVGGVERAYPIVAPKTYVGCVSENDVVLPVRGVSRRHAALTPAPSGVRVEDLESKNGVFVNGARAPHASLLAGDEVRFGPVALRLEEVPAEAAQLAIVLGPARSAPAPGLPSWETTASTASIPDVGATRGLVLPADYVPGESTVMATLYAQMRPLLQGDLPVLLVGETGVGKEHVARILHASTSRSRGPFVAVNCAAIPADLLEAELFGIGKGIATGVVERPGKFQLASGGTLLLDEIGDMPLELQAKLLRALQAREVQPVGSAPVPIDVRVISSTNDDLLRKIEAGRFRRDLYYRVAGYVLRVPPLRERREDLPALVESFIRRFARETGRSVHGLTARALEVLVEYPWPGNVRELEHEVRRLAYLCADGQVIESSMLSEQILAPHAEAEGAPEAADASLSLEAHLQRVEDRLLRQALRRTGGNRTLAAKLLGISRNGLAIKMARLGIKAE